MSTARTWAVALTGVDGHMVEIEADLSNQTPDFKIIGLPDKSLGEAVQRVHNACKNAGLDLPRRRLTVNLSPASLPKHGAGFDLGIAVSTLAAGGAIGRRSIADTVHIGELGLDGRIRPVPGVLPAVFAAAGAGFRRIIVPRGNEAEARLVPGVEVRAAASLAEVAVWHGADVEVPDVDAVAVDRASSVREAALDLADVVGQEEAVEALVVAAAGGHHLLLSGPPGAGKTMLARRLPGILPALGEQEALEVASIRSLSGETVTALDPLPPLEAPHHSASVAALVGGGSRVARPGAIARAHRGVLFLDEAAEFSRAALDALRQPLESGVIDVHRAGFTARFPAGFQLLLAMNPCPCGNYGVRGAECVCPPAGIRRYAMRLSGPLRDRVDIDLSVTRVAASRATAGGRSEVTTARARERVETARARAADRWRSTPWRRNADVPGTWLRQGALRLPPATRAALDRALERGSLTLRGYDRVLRLAWTMADLADLESPGLDEIGRALHLKRGLTP
ncbi:YifB family Mg chelatase-like AAA ATPase [Microbacterium sp. LWH11-1.2]|uniref:YifB family Mg chelatase-like AAA ATPase n=1 Tax=Microbacterium sp. LWH11-1.2 TaxID=3135258 RepID=UPI0031387A28